MPSFKGLAEVIIVLFWLAIVGMLALLFTFGYLIYLLVTHLRWM